MPLVEQEFLTLPEHLKSPPVFSGVRVAQFLVLRVVFVLIVLCPCRFSVGHGFVSVPLIYEFLISGYFWLIWTQKGKQKYMMYVAHF